MVKHGMGWDETLGESPDKLRYLYVTRKSYKSPSIFH